MIIILRADFTCFSTDISGVGGVRCQFIGVRVACPPLYRDYRRNRGESVNAVGWSPMWVSITRLGSIVSRRDCPILPPVK
ncbi:MAG: hypothetical protein OXH65_06285 [Paracoccaceae bacterium]|nr:hypothetical protein [Paracoccaceae bacterium]